MTPVAILFQFYLKEILLLPGGILSLGWLGIPITVLWITGITNSINIIHSKALNGVNNNMYTMTILNSWICQFILSNKQISQDFR
ncbi:MAG: hypothetical protein PVI26_02470 [Chitinispirillia bacterium]